MLKLDTEINIGAFWSWWTGELISLLPASVVDGFNHSNGFLIIEPKGLNVQVTYQNNSGYRNVNTLLGEFEVHEAASKRLKAIIANDAMYSHAEIVIRIPAALGMQKIISLPEIAASNLQQMLTYELDRYTPFNPSQVYYDVVKLGKPVNGQISVALLVVQRHVLDEICEQLSALGLAPAYADCEQQPITQLAPKERYNLLPQTLRHLKSKKPQVVMYCSLGILVVMLLILFVHPLWMAYQGIDKLKTHLHKVEKLALQVEDSKRGIDYLYQATNQLMTKKRNNPALVEIFNLLSKELKDDTSLSQLRYTASGLELLGESGNASALIAALEKTGRFRNTRFISPVTQDRTSGKERFQLLTEIIPVSNNAPESK